MGPNDATGELALRWGWELLSIEHVRENAGARRAAAEKVVSAAVQFYRNDSGVPEACPHFWMQPFVCAFACASLLRDDVALVHLAEWVTPARARGERSPMYNERYFSWPLYQLWAAITAHRRVQGKWRDLIAAETARFPKLLLSATDALLAGEASTCVNAIKGALQLHRKKAAHRGEVMAQRVLSPEICWIASEASRTRVVADLDQQLSDWIATEV